MTEVRFRQAFLLLLVVTSNLSSMAIVLSLTGFGRGLRRPWLAALALALAAFWYAANPWPTFDGWHGLAWRTVLDPGTPAGQHPPSTL